MSYDLFKYKVPPVVFFPVGASRSDRQTYLKEHPDEWDANKKVTNENISNVLWLMNLLDEHNLPGKDQEEIKKLIHEHMANAKGVTISCVRNYEHDRELRYANIRRDVGEGKKDSVKDTGEEYVAEGDAFSVKGILRKVL